MHALNDLVRRQGHATSPTAPTTSNSQILINRALANIDPEGLERPPWEVTEEVLEKGGKYPTMALAIIFPFFKLKNLKGILEDAYQNPGQCGASRRLLAYGILHALFEEFCNVPLDGVERATYGTYVVQCKYQMEVAMSQLDIFMPASYENIMALQLGGALAIEMCKPSLCWVMMSTAAGLCQSLGYHRYSTMKDDSEEERNCKIHVFWMIYMFDKTMSLRLGRASVIQDWDISLPFFEENKKAEDGLNGKEMLAYWVKVGRVQGQTYEKLFSPAAFLRSPEERMRTAIELVNSLNTAWYERGDARVTDLAYDVDRHHGVQTQLPVAANSSPNETDMPSIRKRRGKQPLAPPIDAGEYIKSKSRMKSITQHSQNQGHSSVSKTCFSTRTL